jgi:hypothetical protein
MWCFAGQRLYRMIVSIGGMLLGAGIAARLLTGQSDVVYYGGIILAAVIVGFIFYRLYNLQIVLIGALMGIVLGLLVISAFNIGDEWLRVLILAMGAIIGTGIANALSKVILRVGTAFVGASMIVAGGLFYLGRANVSANGRDITYNVNQVESLIALVVILVLAFIGYAFQTRTRPLSEGR